MPPSTPEHEPQKASIGPTIGIAIIVILILTGAVYFWDNRQNQKIDAVPYIPGDTSTTSVQ